MAAPGRRCVSYHWKELVARDLRWLDTVFQGQYLPSLSINYVITMLLRRCYCNPDHNKFSSLPNTTVGAIFPNLCLWRRSLFSNLGGIDPEKLYRATLKRSATFHLLIQSCQLCHLFCKLLMNGIITALCGITLSWLLTILNLLRLFLKATASARM